MQLPGWLKWVLVVIGIWIFCYAFNISPLGIIDHAMASLRAMHQSSASTGSP